MTTVQLDHGESVMIVPRDGDGCFTVKLGANELTIEADMPGSHLGGQGVIYREVYGGCSCKYEQKPDPDELLEAVRTLQRWSWTLPLSLREASPWKELDRLLKQEEVDPRCPAHGEMASKVVAVDGCTICGTMNARAGDGTHLCTV